MGEVMKTIKGIKALYFLTLAMMLASCNDARILQFEFRDSGSLVSNQARGSRSGNVLAGGQLAIDLPIRRPPLTSSKWIEVIKNYQGMNQFVSLAEGTNVTIPDWIYQDSQIFFWGDLKSSLVNALQIGNIANEQQFFNTLDQQNFQFELSIWDAFTGQKDPQTNKKFDFLGYAYFGQHGSNKVGNLTANVYQSSSNRTYVGVKFTDAMGDVIIEFELIRNTNSPLLSTMSGNISFRGANRNTTVLGYFTDAKVCDLFKCQ